MWAPRPRTPGVTHRHGLDFAPEPLYVGAPFHDLGLTEQFRTSPSSASTSAAPTRPAPS
ncbi:hypothetical protein [Streptomyces decoyicus]